MIHSADRKCRLLPLFIVAAMLMLQLWITGMVPVSAAGDAVVNTTTYTGYGILQDAIDAADDGDIIEVHLGDYGSVVIDKAITLFATNGPEFASIDYIQIKDTVDVTIDGFSIHGSDLSYNTGISFAESVTGSGTITIQNCVFADGIAYAIDGYGVLAGTNVLIANNSFNVFSNAIAINESLNQGTEIVIDGNIFTNGNDSAITFSSVGDRSRVWIKNNQFSDIVYDAISISGVGGDPDESLCEIIIEDNQIRRADYGIYLYNISNGILTIRNNSIEDCESLGIYIEQSGINGFSELSPAITRYSGPVQIAIENNAFSGCFNADWSMFENYGAIAISSLVDSIHSPIQLDIINNSFMSNFNGMRFQGILLNNTDSSICISKNAFIGNSYGVNIAGGWIEVADPDQFCIGLNHFSANSEFALLYGGVMPFNVRADQLQTSGASGLFANENWWGDANGPFLKEPEMGMDIAAFHVAGEGDGDPVSPLIEFDPWISTLALSTSKTNAYAGNSIEVRAQILNNAGQPTLADGLIVRFRVTGVHNTTFDVPVSGTSAIGSYIGTAVGTDTISAEVIFAGLSSGLDARMQAPMVWMTAPANPDSETTPTDSADTQVPVPKMGDDSAAASALIPPAVVLVLLAAALVWYKKSRQH